MYSENVEEYDYMIVGSSLSNALLTNVLSWKGFKVLSIDENDYYGDYTAALSVDQICDQFKDVFINDENISQNKTRFGVDLIPSYILCDSKMIKYIMNFNIYRYLEVVKLDNFYTFNAKNDSFDKLKTTKQDIFTDTSISPITKRTIMKCIKFLVEEVNEENQIWKDYKDNPIMDLFTDKFSKLPVNLINEFVFTICNCFDSDHLTTKMASDIITKFFKSYNVYGDFPALLTKYGGLGEIIQGVYRSAALIGN
ncbi:FAD/NAD(P)-binding domain-containing protein, partial [Hanseniaspora valbyensis NRRL Y-1626]